MDFEAVIRQAILGAATDKPATFATPEADIPQSVAGVATLAVAGGQEPASCVARVAVAQPRKRLDWYEEALKEGRVHVCHSTTVSTCGSCQHFRRVNHPHLGTCAMGEPEGVCGNWDTDPRNYCVSFNP